MISDLTKNDTVEAPFMVQSLRLAAFRNKPGSYLDLRLGDRTGEITGRMWDDAEAAAAALSPGDVVLVEGRVEEYKGALQLVVGALRLAEAEEYDLSDLVRCASRPREEMLEELLATIEEVQDPHLHGLLEDVFGDADFRQRFADAPGAAKLHHACVGGLLEHTLSVAQVCRQAAAQHPRLNRDLLLTGALLHDLGKLQELEGRGAYDYSDEGRFCGHVVLTDRLLVAALARREDFPLRLGQLLTHMLLSHHGELEWGAPVKPKTAEALALHYADNLDAKVQIFEDYRDSAESGSGEWSEYHRSMERNLYLGSTAAEPEASGESSKEETGTASSEEADMAASRQLELGDE